MKLGSSNLAVLTCMSLTLCTLSWHAYDHKRSAILKASVDTTTCMSTFLTLQLIDYC